MPRVSPLFYPSTRPTHSNSRLDPSRDAITIECRHGDYCAFRDGDDGVGWGVGRAVPGDAAACSQ